MSTSSIDQVLENLLNSLTPTQTRKVMQAIANYLRGRNLYRITAQQNADGSAYIRRKNTQDRRKMLVGFRKHIKSRVQAQSIELGIFGNAARLARVHQDGQNEKGITYPARQLVTLPAADKEQIRSIVLSLIQGN